MTTPQQAGAPAPVPPAVPVQPPPQGAAGSAGQGAFSNVIGSLVAVITYVTGALAAIPDHAATCVDSGASRPDRARAFTLLAGKLALLGLLVFAAWQEWQQHIIYATETAAAQAKKAAADASIAANEAKIKQQKTDVSTMRFPTAEETKQFVCGDAERRRQSRAVKEMGMEYVLGKQPDCDEPTKAAP